MALVQTGTASTSCTREIQDSKIQDCCGVFSWNLGYRGPDRYRAPVFKIPKKGPAAILCLGILHLPGTTCTGLYRGQGRYPGSLGRGSLSHKMVYQLPTASTIYCFRVVGFTQPQIGRSMGGYHSLLRYIVYLCLSLAPSLFCFLSLSLCLCLALSFCVSFVGPFLGLLQICHCAQRKRMRPSIKAETPHRTSEIPVEPSFLAACNLNRFKP